MRSCIEWSYFQYDGDELAAEYRDALAIYEKAVEIGDIEAIDEAIEDIEDIRDQVNDAFDNIENIRTEASSAYDFFDNLFIEIENTLDVEVI